MQYDEYFSTDDCFGLVEMLADSVAKLIFKQLFLCSLVIYVCTIYNSDFVKQMRSK